MFRKGRKRGWSRNRREIREEKKGMYKKEDKYKWDGWRQRNTKQEENIDEIKKE